MRAGLDKTVIIEAAANMADTQEMSSVTLKD